MSAFGPLFRHELTRLARRGLQPRFRTAFAGLLLVALLVTYLQSFPGESAAGVLTSVGEPLSIEAAANFAERFLISFLVVQLLVVCVVTPVVVAGAITEERDRGTLDFLLSSPLSNAEIVLGKMAARLAFMVGLLLTGLPVLTLTMFFGGVDGGQLLAGYAITLATVFSAGTMTLLMVAEGQPLAGVLLRVYLWQIGATVFGFCCGCLRAPVFVSPFAALLVLFTGWVDSPGTARADAMWLAGIYAGVHLFFGAWWLVLAVRRVREEPLLAQTVNRMRASAAAPLAYPLPRDD
ncbi:MAG TPA: ABC transporter permease subunit, partial [Gemmataceae bacterium]|nr:ABC transporter permease subunit [Gemmataceae bacterium]